MLMSNLTRECPEPGVYPDIEFNQYVTWDALSNSGVSLLAKSPRHFQDGDRCDPTPDMRLGELFHTGVLEPESIARRYAIMPPFELDPRNCTDSGAPSESKGTKWYRQMRRDFEADNTGREIVARDKYETMMTLVRELSLNADAKRLLNDDGPVEVSIVWDEYVEGHDQPVRCKARLDKVAITERAIVDLKKCQDVLRFSKDIANRKYYRQMAFYQRGWAALHDGELFTPWLVPHEAVRPICVLAAPLDEVALLEGNEQIEKWLKLYAECRFTGRWDGPPNPVAFSIPDWEVTPVSMQA